MPGMTGKTAIVPRWLRLTDHRDVGTATILLAVVAGLVGGAMSLVLRLPTLNVGASWRVAALQHGPIVMFFSAIPALTGGFGNWFVPLLIGARNTAFPWLGAVSFWLGALGFVLTMAGLLDPDSVLLLPTALHLAGIGMLLCAANLVATALNMRRPGMTLGEIPVFVWSQLLAGCLTIVAIPMLVAALTLAGIDATQQASRFYFYPGFCIIILPGLGMVSQIVSTFCARPLVGRRPIIVAMTVLAISGFLAWAHQLLDHGVASDDSLFGVVSMLAVVVPALFIAVCWSVTLGQASVPARVLLARTPGLFALGFVVVLVVGGLASLWRLASNPAAAPLHDAVSLGAVFALFAGFYYWIGRMTGKPYPELLGRLQFGLLFLGVAIMFTGASSNGSIAAAGAALASLSILVFALVVLITLSRRAVVSPHQWGPGAVTLEWTIA
ncbi:MAG: cbb3-type cytochrome c oxidase subunit I [Janthinobacterium lividum]